MTSRMMVAEMSFAVDADWKLLPGKPITIYSGDDRRSGRIYKWTSSKPYQAGMKKAQIRDLLSEGNLYVAHFADLDNSTGITLQGGKQATESAPGKGQWILLSLANNSDLAPNAGTSAGPADTTVGAALQDNAWNAMGGFTSDDHLRRALFTASNKLGVMELNRPEDLEWNPKDPSGTPRLYIAFTKHGAQTALAQDGTLYAPDQWAMNAPKRPDSVGTIFALEEADPADPAVRYAALCLDLTRQTPECRLQRGKPDGAPGAGNIRNKIHFYARHVVSHPLLTRIVHIPINSS